MKSAEPQAVPSTCTNRCWTSVIHSSGSLTTAIWACNGSTPFRHDKRMNR